MNIAQIFPVEIFHIILEFSDGFERENMRPVCKEFDRYISTICRPDSPALHREVKYLSIYSEDDYLELLRFRHEDLIIYINNVRKITTFDHECMYIMAYNKLYRLLAMAISYDNVCWNGALEGGCYIGDRTIISISIVYGANDWNRGLFKAAQGGHIDIMDMMIEKGATEYGYTMIYACAGGHIEAVKWIIDNLEDDFQEYREIYISGACERGYMDIAIYFIELYNVTALDKYLTITSKYGYYKLSKYLISKGAKNFNECLDIAAKYGRASIAYLLIKNGATGINKATNIAFTECQYEFVVYAYNHGSTEYESIFLASCALNNRKLMEIMMEKGVTNFNGGLLYACSHNNNDLIDFLISKGANNFYEALSLSHMMGYKTCMEIIARRKAHINDMMIQACKKGNSEILQYLIEMGGNNIDECLGIVNEMGHTGIKTYLTDKTETN